MCMCGQYIPGSFFSLATKSLGTRLHGNHTHTLVLNSEYALISKYLLVRMSMVVWEFYLCMAMHVI